MGVREASAKYRLAGDEDFADDGAPRGYKLSEVGVIPGDWDVHPLGDCSRIKTGGRNNEDKEDGGQYPFYVRSEYVERINSFSYECEAVLIPGEGRIGDVFHYVDGRFDVHQRVYAITDFRSCVSAKFVFYYLKQHFGPHALKNTVKATVDSLRLPVFKGFKLAVPPVDEQKAIAEALSDTDALIESLQQLITKKRALKQGAMQALLMGRQRLPGFDGEWAIQRLDELADIRSGGTPATGQPAFWAGDVLWCTPTDITVQAGRKYLRDTARKITVKGLQASSAELIPAGSIVMTSRATIGQCAINQVPVTTNQGFKNFVPFDSVDVEFLYYLLLTQTNGFVSLCGGSTFLEIGKVQLAGYEVTLPSSREEQTAIATVLSDMDADIHALEARLAKTRDLKAGMMHALLTGRIRLPLDQAA
jgi:type I restriction enzyme S subunit